MTKELQEEIEQEKQLKLEVLNKLQTSSEQNVENPIEIEENDEFSIAMKDIPIEEKEIEITDEE